MSDRDTIKDYDECFRHGRDFWRNAWKDMKEDLRFFEDDQLSGEEKQYIANQRRQPYVFNFQKKIVRLLTGYERKTRLQLIVGPTGQDIEADDACTQHTACLAHTMNRRSGHGYQVFSDAFKFGTIIEGMNLVDIWPDHRRNICFGRRPYNKFILDPNFTDLSLSDCQYVIMGDALTKEAAKKLVSLELGKDIDRAFVKGQGSSSAGLSDWPFMTKKLAPYKDDLRKFEQFWERKTKKDKLVLDKESMEFIPLKYILRPWMSDYEKREMLQVLHRFPQKYSLLDGEIDTVTMSIFYNGELLRTYEDPYGIGDFNFVLLAGDFQPEEEDARMKIAGLLRSTKDPQRAENRRMMQMLDIAEKQITTGYKSLEDCLVNPEALYQSGQNVPLIIKKGHSLDEVVEIIAKDIPGGFFALEQNVASKVLDLMGISEETFGAGDKDIPIGLWMMRQGAALTIFQEPFDNYRNARKQAGRKLVRMHQAVFGPQKVKRIVKDEIAKGFYEADFEKFDCSLEEGILTESQRKLAFAQLMQLKEMGAPIPWSMIMDFMPVQLSRKYKDVIKQQQKQEAKIGELQLQTQTQAAQAEISEKKSKAMQNAAYMIESQAEADRARSQGMNQKAQAIKTMQEVEFGQAKEILDRLVKLEQITERKVRRKAISKR